MNTLAIILILAGPGSCFLGCLVAALGDVWCEAPRKAKDYSADYWNR